MTVKCKMTGEEAVLPCSASGCPLFGDCIAEYAKERRKSKVKPTTNADRIRAMSDEELAKFLECFGLCHYCTEHHRLGDLRIYADEKCDEKCVEHSLEWLKQPAEGE